MNANAESLEQNAHYLVRYSTSVPSHFQYCLWHMSKSAQSTFLFCGLLLSLFSTCFVLLLADVNMNSDNFPNRIFTRLSNSPGQFVISFTSF